MSIQPSSPDINPKMPRNNHLRLVNEDFTDDTEFDGGDGGRIVVTFSGKAAEQIRQNAEALGMNNGDFVALSVSLGVAATHAYLGGETRLNLRGIMIDD
jgi:uncharacterized caspase-like protein